MTDYVLEGPKWGSPAYGSTGGTVTWAIDASVPAAFLPVLSAAFADWSAHANIGFTQVTSTAQSQIDFSVGTIDGLNGVLGETTFTSSHGTLVSAAVEFDSGEGWHLTGSKELSNSGINLFLVALHEVGHALGLDHYNAAAAVMSALLNRSVSDLTTSDIDGIQALYGAPPTAITQATSGTSASTATTTPTVISKDASAQPVYRFYDTSTGDHFYTADLSEASAIKASLPSFTDEGTSWATPGKSSDTVDVFRFFDTVTKTHFLTQDANEAATIKATLPTFTDEGVAFQAYAYAGADGTFALERFYNTNSHVHTYVADASEIALIKSGQVGQGWVDEGASFIVHHAPA